MYKNKKFFKISIFLFKAYIDLKSWLIVPKCQFSARQLFLILKVSNLFKIFRLSTNFINHNY